MKYLKEIVKKNRFMTVLYIAIGIGIAFFENFGPSYFQVVLDHFSNGTLTVPLVTMYGVFLIAAYLLSYAEEYPNMYLGQRIYLDLKYQALKKISRMDYQAYLSYGTGMLVQRIENGAQAGKGILFEFYIRLIRSLIPSICFSLFFIWKYSKMIMLAILAGYVLVFLITNLLLKYLYKVKEKILVNEEEMNHFLVRGFMEMLVFRIHKRFEKEMEKTRNAQNEIVHNKVKMQMIHEGFFTSFAILIAIIKIIIVVYAWKTNSMTVGEVVAVIALTDNAYTPIAIFNVLYVQYKLDCTAFDRYRTFLEEKDDTQLLTGERVIALTGAIEMKDLGFAYDDRTILEHYDLSIQPGEQIAFVGASGSGKSTVIKLLVGLLKPEKGKILLDGRDLSRLKLNDVYQHIAYISQESPIFDGTIKENIVFDQNVSDEKLRYVLQQVHLDELISSLKDGYNTYVGERGVTLSGGERQRLALARLWFEEDSIIILDEATSAMDNVTEELVMSNVVRELRGRTLIVIAHRLHTIEEFPRIVVMKDGKILGDGTYQSLDEQNTYFNQLVHLKTEIA